MGFNNWISIHFVFRELQRTTALNMTISWVLNIGSYVLVKPYLRFNGHQQNQIQLFINGHKDLAKLNQCSSHIHRFLNFLLKRICHHSFGNLHYPA